MLPSPIDSEPVDSSPGSDVFRKKENEALNHIDTDEPTSTFLRVVRNFSTVWFTIAMDTGVLGTILHQFPYPSHWARVCATIMFVTNILLFVVFSGIHVLHWTIFYKTTVKYVRSESEEIALQACPAIAWMIIASDVQLICAQSWGPAFTIIAYVMWWIGVIWITTICLMLYLHLIRFPSSRVVDKGLPTAVFIPIVGIFTAANLASIIVTGATNKSYISDRLAVPTVIIGFTLVGCALGIAMMMYAIYMHRLMTSGLPEPLKIPGMILTIGPCGQSATALLGLGNAAVQDKHFAEYSKGFFITEEAAPIIRIICVVLALLLLGFAIFWIIVDYYAIIEGLIRHTIHPSLFWWSSIFPMATVVTALTTLGNDMDSPAFKILAVVAFCFLFCVYLLNASFTIPMTLSGELLGLPRRNIWPAHRLDIEHGWAKFPRRKRIT